MAGMLPANRGNKSGNRIGPAVSRKLRSFGWNISPAARKYLHLGVFVSARGEHVSVMVDLGLSAKNKRVAEGIEDDLRNWDRVSDVKVEAVEDVFFVFATYQTN